MAALALAATVAAACFDYNVPDINGPSIGDVITSPTQAKLATVATGIFAGARRDMEQYIWRLGSMGREGANLLGNNQPDYSEPFFGPLSSSEFGGSLWAREYSDIRTINTYLDAVPKAPDLAPADQAASLAFGETIKALMLFYVIQPHANLGAPVDVDRPVGAAPAPFVAEDSVYGYILGLLDSARTHLAAAGGTFPFTVPPGWANFNTPATFVQFTWALTAKAQVFRATAANGCQTVGGPANCYTAALAALGTSFEPANTANFAFGAYFDFSAAAGDLLNGLSENGFTYYALHYFQSDAQLQPSSALDQRVLSKIVPAKDTQTLGGIPDIRGDQKFTIYWDGGTIPNAAHPIPILREEELILLKAEAEIGLGQTGPATADLNTVRTTAGGLAPLAGGLTAAQLLTDLIYERRYSLMWEQGTRWIDARRYGLLATIPIAVTNPAPGQVPKRMPIPTDECNARRLTTPCSPLGT